MDAEFLIDIECGDDEWANIPTIIRRSFIHLHNQVQHLTSRIETISRTTTSPATTHTQTPKPTTTTTAAAVTTPSPQPPPPPPPPISITTKCHHTQSRRTQGAVAFELVNALESRVAQTEIGITFLKHAIREEEVLRKTEQLLHTQIPAAPTHPMTDNNTSTSSLATLSATIPELNNHHNHTSKKEHRDYHTEQRVEEVQREVVALRHQVESLSRNEAIRESIARSLTPRRENDVYSTQQLHQVEERSKDLAYRIQRLEETSLSNKYSHEEELHRCRQKIEKLEHESATKFHDVSHKLLMLDTVPPPTVVTLPQIDFSTPLHEVIERLRTVEMNVQRFEDNATAQHQSFLRTHDITQAHYEQEFKTLAQRVSAISERQIQNEQLIHEKIAHEKKHHDTTGQLHKGILEKQQELEKATNLSEQRTNLALTELSRSLSQKLQHFQHDIYEKCVSTSRLVEPLIEKVAVMEGDVSTWKSHVADRLNVSLEKMELKWVQLQNEGVLHRGEIERIQDDNKTFVERTTEAFATLESEVKDLHEIIEANLKDTHNVSSLRQVDDMVLVRLDALENAVAVLINQSSPLNVHEEEREVVSSPQQQQQQHVEEQEQDSYVIPTAIETILSKLSPGKRQALELSAASIGTPFEGALNESQEERGVIPIVNPNTSNVWTDAQSIHSATAAVDSPSPPRPDYSITLVSDMYIESHQVMQFYLQSILEGQQTLWRTVIQPLVLSYCAVDYDSLGMVDLLSSFRSSTQEELDAIRHELSLKVSSDMAANDFRRCYAALEAKCSKTEVLELLKSKASMEVVSRQLLWLETHMMPKAECYELLKQKCDVTFLMECLTRKIDKE